MFKDNELSSLLMDPVFALKEKQRLEALKSYEILDTPEEKEFDRLTELAAIICETPIAAISLIDETRQWFKSKVGLNINFTDREQSICNYTILNNQLFQVEDVSKDVRFKNNPFVTGPTNLRFYAGFPLIDPNGFALGALCVFDLKPRKLNLTQERTLEVLAKEVVSQIIAKKEHFEKQQFEELFIRSIDMVCMAGIDGFFKKVNPAFSVVLGWTNKELLERPFIDFVHPDDKVLTIAELNNLLNGIRTVNFCNRYLTKSGNYKTLSWVANPDVSKGLIYAIARDKTELIASQQQLLTAEKKFRDIFENSPDAIFVEDIAGNILDVNSAAIMIQGLPKKNLVGTNIRHLVPKDKYLKLLGDYKKLFLGAVRTVESSLWSALKGEIPVEVSGKKIAYGDQSALLLLVRDISERKKMEVERLLLIREKEQQQEEQLRNNLRIQEEERRRIAAEMHDDVGAGLSRISILGQVIKKSAHNSSAVVANIEKVLESSKLIQENISEIIWAMDPKNDKLENLVSYINYYASEFLESSNIDFKIDFPSEIPDMVIKSKIRRNIFLIIKESLNNIVKYAEATSVNIKIRLNHDSFSIIIRDNGVGFNLEKRPRFSNGIDNMSQRTKEIGGNIKIISGKLTGTTVYLRTPVSAITAQP